MQPLGRQNVELTRFQGPKSGLLFSAAGEVLTSLYNLTNVAALVEPTWERPAGAGVEEGLEAIQGLRVHLASGTSYPATLTAYDPSLGIALLSPTGALEVSLPARPR